MTQHSLLFNFDRGGQSVASFSESTCFSAQSPTFLIDRMRFFYRETIDVRRNKKHLVLGNQQASSNSVMLVNNDYLSMAQHPEIVAAQIEALSQQTQELLMSAVFLQGHNPQHDFESEMAQYLGYEKTILCQSGWAANEGLVQVIANEHTPVYIDILTHASLWNGIALSKAPLHSFKHNDVAHLERLLKESGSGIIMVDSVYSTLGTVAPLEALARIAQAYDCLFIVDESHSLGTHGPSGAGLVAELKLTDKVHFITASLAKAFAARAGIIACSAEFAGYFPYNAHPAIFSSAVRPHEIAALAATLRIIQSADLRRHRVHANADYLRTGLRDLGYCIASTSQILALEPGQEDLTEILRDALESRHIFGSVFCRPATAKNKAIIRFSVNSDLTHHQLNDVLNVCDDIREIVRMKEWRSTARQRALTLSCPI